MSARKKVHGNRAVTCDVEGCSTVYVAAWWGNGASEARLQAQERGWTRCFASDGVAVNYRDVCNEHAEHPPTCRCLRPIDSPPADAEIRSHDAD